MRGGVKVSVGYCIFFLSGRGYGFLWMVRSVLEEMNLLFFWGFWVVGLFVVFVLGFGVCFDDVWVCVGFFGCGWGLFVFVVFVCFVDCDFVYFDDFGFVDWVCIGFFFGCLKVVMWG